MTTTSTIRKFTFDIGWVFVSQVVVLLMGFVLQVLLGRLLGADGLGLYNMSAIVYSLAGLVGGMGIPAAMVKFAAEYKNDRAKLTPFVSCAFIVSLAFGGAIAFVLFILSDTIARLFGIPGLANLIKIVAIALPFLVLNNTLLLGLLTGLREMKLYSIGMACRPILLFGVAVLLVKIGWEAKGAVLAVMFAEMGTFILSLFLTRKHLRFYLGNYLQATRILIPFGAQLFLAGAIYTVNTQADRLFIGYFLSAKDVGIYAIAATIATALWIISEVVSTVTYPMMSEFHSKGMHRENEVLMNKVMKYTLIIQSILGILVIFLARDIISLLVGSEFLPAVIPLAILVFGIMLTSPLTSTGSAFSAMNRPDMPFKLNLVMLVTNVGLNIVLIPKLGITGSAIAMAVSQLVGIVLGIYLRYTILNVRLNIKLYPQVLIPAAGIIFVFFTFQNRMNTYLIGGILFVTYLILSIAFLLTSDDRRELTGIFKAVSSIGFFFPKDPGK